MNQESTDRKASLWLRLFFVIIALAAIAGTLGYLKYQQIQVQIAQGSSAPAPISVTVAIAEDSQWNRKIKAIGSLVAFQGVDITTEVSGIITSINFDSGNEVAEESLLLELDNRTEMANLESARAQFDSDNSHYQRLLKLKDESFVTKTDIDTQASQVDISKAQINVAKAALSKKRIYAPFSGKLGIRHIDIGEYIAPGSKIVTLLSLDKLYLDFTLPERNFNDLVIEQAIEFKVRSYPDQVFSARVETWNPELDINTRNIQVRAVVDNQERLLAPGMFAEMKVQSRRQIPVLTVPETAIFYNIYGEAVYILEDSSGKDSSGEDSSGEDSGESETTNEPEYRLAARQINVAYRTDGVAGVSKGLEAGDIVVTSGQLKLFPSLLVAIVEDVPEYESGTQ